MWTRLTKTWKKISKSGRFRESTEGRRQPVNVVLWLGTAGSVGTRWAITSAQHQRADQRSPEWWSAHGMTFRVSGCG